MAHEITPHNLKNAHETFKEKESRDLFYRVARDLVDLAWPRKAYRKIAEATAVLLQTWNKQYYRYRKFDKTHFKKIKNLIQKRTAVLDRYRLRTIDRLDAQEKAEIQKLFQGFQSVLGPVGSAKALHVIAPRFFPLWDSKIIKAYKRELGRACSNAERYWEFMLISQRQYIRLGCKDRFCQSLLKSIDEYNYCKYTKEWL